MHFDLQRTIVAVSSGIAPARRAIVRLSGSQTAHILQRLIADDGPQQLAKQSLLTAKHATSALLDCLLGWQSRRVAARIYFWPDSRSFTGEPSAEIHLIGSLPLVEALVEFLLQLGAAPAERGEFTLRSFLAGKVDLTQAEAVLGVIEADAPAQLQWALEQLGGNLSRPVRRLRDKLLELIAHLEAGLDFVEEDIEFISQDQLQAELESVRRQLLDLVHRLELRGTRSRTPQVVLLGLPNAGKSSLFNALLRKERAIVTSQAGTTRDALSEATKLEELQVELVDTAGIEELHEDSPRALAQTVLQNRIARADAILFCVDLTAPPDEAWFLQQLASLRNSQTPLLLVGTKLDACARPADLPSIASTLDVHISCHQPASIDLLRQRLLTILADSRRDSHSDAMHHTMVRCKASLELALAALDRALQLLAEAGGEELVATELRFALEDLSAIIGEVHTEDILGEIFSRFCIGK